MRKPRRRRLSRSAGWALAAVVGMPALAEAQHTGIFPLKPARKRERGNCAQEDPIYKMYRQQFYGYYPTMWRKFPPGWHMMSPEGPDAAESFRTIPRDKSSLGANLEGGDEPELGPDEGMPNGGRAGGNNNNNNNRPNDLPPLPSGDRSPFELDNVKPANPATPAEPPARGALGAPRASAGETPLEFPTVAGPTLSPPAPGAPAVPDPELPSPAAPVGPATDGNGPLLAVPDPTVSGTSAAAPVAASGAFTDPSPFGTPKPARRGFLSNLFGNRAVRR